MCPSAADDDDEEEENGEAEGVKAVVNGNTSLIVSGEEEEAEAAGGNATATQEAAGPTEGKSSGGLSPLTDSDVTDLSPMSAQEPSPRDSPSQSQPPAPAGHGPSNGVAAVKRETAAASNKVSVVPVSARSSPRAADLSPAAASVASLPPSPAAAVQTNQDSSTATCDLLSANGTASPLSLRFSRDRKRKREDKEKRKSHIHALLPDR